MWQYVEIGVSLPHALTLSLLLEAIESYELGMHFGPDCLNMFKIGSFSFNQRNEDRKLSSLAKANIAICVASALASTLYMSV
jgi:hypothetical protein